MCCDALPAPGLASPFMHSANWAVSRGAGCGACQVASRLSAGDFQDTGRGEGKAAADGDAEPERLLLLFNRKS